MWSIVSLWTVVILVLFFIYSVVEDREIKTKTIGAVLSATLVIVGIFASYRLTNTASFERSMKSLNSEFKQNIYREIKVHSRSGDIIYESKGRFDVEHIDGRLKWVDEEGRVQIIYLGDSATAVVNELDDSK